MTIRLTERPNSRSATSNPDTRVLRYSLTGIHDDVLAKAYARAATPTIYDSLYRQDVKLDPLGNSTWDVEVPYAAQPSNSDIGSVTVTFDTTGGTAHITQAREHIQSYAAVGTAPDHEGAINVTENGPEGVDIVVPEFSWVEEWTLAISYASFTSALLIKATTGRVNSTPFRGFPAGEVRFDGGRVRASNTAPDKANGTFRFTQSDNVADAMPDFKAGIVKQGWHYLWIEYEKKEDATAKKLVQRPAAAHVERVCDTADFSVLGIGTGMIE